MNVDLRPHDAALMDTAYSRSIYKDSLCHRHRVKRGDFFARGKFGYRLPTGAGFEAGVRELRFPAMTGNTSNSPKAVVQLRDRRKAAFGVGKAAIGHNPSYARHEHRTKVLR